MERVKRLKSSLQHRKGEREKSMPSGIVCVRGQLWVCGRVRGGLHKNWCCAIITRALFALLWILPEAVPWATNSPAVKNRWATRPCVHYYAVYSKYSKLTLLHLSLFTNTKYLKVQLMELSHQMHFDTSLNLLMPPCVVFPPFFVYLFMQFHPSVLWHALPPPYLNQIPVFINLIFICMKGFVWADS